MILTERNEGLTRENLIVPGVTSEKIFTTNIEDNIKNNFYIAVTITKTNGDKQNYQIKLDATEVTQTIDNN